MTEAWKSNPMYWCDVCRCWLNDSKAARQHHEQGMGHIANLARKLREMGKKAEQEKHSAVAAAAAMARIEEQARKKYEADKAAAEQEAEAVNGRWVWDDSCSYYYNERHRWYYDPKTKWYYGGEPAPEWKQAPPIPAGALFGTAPHEGAPVPQVCTAAASAPTAVAGARPASSTSEAASDAPQRQQQVVVQLPEHPMARVGGHQAPTIGRVGAAKGVTAPSKPSQLVGSTAAAAAAGGDKRKRADGQISKEEAEARARREAARQRVAERTAQSFGYL